MYGFDDNKEYDLLDKILKNTVVLSEDVKQKFYGIMLTVRQHGGPERHGEAMKEAAIELQKDLLNLAIFKEEFIHRITGLLMWGIGTEKKLQTKK